MKERAILFGRDALSGVVTPAIGAAAATGVVFLGAGILHRVGPNRMHVALARALAAAGLPSLRFDFSGIGESDVGTGQMTYDERTRRETQDAMDALAAAERVDRFLLFGLCSGADSAVRVAVADPRVRGAVLVQPYSFTRPGYTLEHYGRRLVTRSFWTRLLRGGVSPRQTAAELLRTLRPRPSGEADADDLSRSWRMPEPSAIVAAVTALLARGTDLLFVYSRPSPAEYNYRTIIRPRIEGGGTAGRAQVETFTESDHTFMRLAHQARLVLRVVEWARGRMQDGANAMGTRRTA
jgi:hypothetical protein